MFMKTTIIIAHPYYENSKNIKKIIEGIIREIPEIDLRLIDKKGKFNIEEEKNWLLKYDEIFFAFPIWWYTTPWTLKKYIDEVFLPGFAFSFKNNIKDFKLNDKKFGYIISVGNVKETYKPKKGNIDYLENHNKWLQATFHLISSAWTVGKIENDVSKYMFDPIICWGASINLDNKENIEKSIKKFVSIYKK